ncbi:MAG: rhodanese-related sulfurtransferase [Verrucomicrobiota bacterium]|nr:rhodanese-related sulfurtransferase [Verrucomicrobiota bacterium]
MAAPLLVPKLAPAHIAESVGVWPVILFYKYVVVADPEQLAAEQRAVCSRLQLKGRVLIAEEGINGTLAGSVDAVNEYVSALHSDPRFTDVEIKVSAGDETTFPKLVVKVRPEIVTLGAGPLTPRQDNQLAPAEWKRVIEQDRDVVLLDVRNRYESDAGRFEGAVVCDIEHFRELPAFVDELEALKQRKVLMYCTGGIRCEKASALLRERGFTDVYQLHGGIVSYQEQFGNEHWQGECFVFDQRMTVRVQEDLVQIGRCAHTSRPTSRFVNCLHDPCHKLFLLAAETETENAETILCPDCLAVGLTRETAEYVRK